MWNLSYKEELKMTLEAKQNVKSLYQKLDQIKGYL